MDQALATVIIMGCCVALAVIIIAGTVDQPRSWRLPVVVALVLIIILTLAFTDSNADADRPDVPTTRVER